jgi:hypothetical protein
MVLLVTVTTAFTPCGCILLPAMPTKNAEQLKLLGKETL